MNHVEEPQAGLLVEPSARTYQLANLVSLVRDGMVRVPHFQRGLRWKRSDAVALIDSVLRGFPIGSLLLWRRAAPAESLRLGQVGIEAPARSDALYVVDGQQRITTFLNVLDPEVGLSGDFALVYDLKQRPFRVRPRGRHEPEEHAIALPVLFELTKLLRWVSDHPAHADDIDEINRATQRLREFHVPAYEVRSQDDRVLREIYDRMNNSGKRLSRAEAFWGLYAPSDVEATTLDSIQEHVETSMGWGRLDANTVLYAFLARRGPDTTRDIHLEFRQDRRKSLDFPAEDREHAHAQALAAMERAIEFLRTEVGVPHFTFLAYRYLLVVLTRFFAHFLDTHERNRMLLRRWYWRSALVGPGIAGGSSTGAARVLAACIRPGDESGSVQRLLRAVEGKPRFQPDVRDFGTNRASGHIMLCALWALGPRSPETESPFESADLAAEIGQGSSPRSVCPELFERGSLPKGLRSSLGNRVLAPGMPEDAVQELVAANDEVMASHQITGPAEEPGDLVKRREEQLSQFIRDWLSERSGEEFDDSPPLDSLNLDDDDAQEAPW